MQTYDLIIIGAGPSGLSAAIAAQQAGFSYLVLERGAITNTIINYPLQTAFFSTAPNLTIGNVPWSSIHPHPTRSEALAYYRGVVEHFGLNIHMYEPVQALERLADGRFQLQTTRHDQTRASYQCQALIVASGSYDTPNQLDIAGAELSKVLHYYREGHPYYRQNVAVIGGGNSAAEAALDLYYHGANVSIIHQFASLDQRIKPWIAADLQAWIDAGKIQPFWEANVTAISPTSIQITKADGSQHEQPNDWVFALIGYRPNTSMLEAVGVDVDADAVPSHDPATFETNVPNLFIAGVLAAGAHPSKIFIENGREHGPAIIAALRQRWAGKA